MTPSELSAAHELAVKLARWAIDETRAYRVTSVHTKAHPADLVTELDRAIERRAREVVLDRFPDHAFVGEEYGGSARTGVPTWYLDPVDGTTNLANGVPWTAFSLALAVDDQPLVGVVAEPWQNAVFEAVAGQGARRDGIPLHLPEHARLRGGVVGTELAGHEPWPGMDDVALSLTAAFCALRVMGSGTLTLLGPAAGRGCAALVHRFSPIDHLAAVLIAHEAGAEVRDEDGRPSLFPRRGGVLVASGTVADEMSALWSRALAGAAPDARARAEISRS